MRKFWEKHDLIKVSGIMILLTVLLTWVIPGGYFDGTALQSEDITRVGLTNFMQYGLLGIYYFTVLVTFLFVLGGFYQLIGKSKGYQQFVKSMSESFKGSETLLVLVSMFLFGALNSVTNEFFPLLVFMPLVVSILSRLKVDKISTFNATFGGLLIGVLGSTLSSKVVGYINSIFNTTNTTYLAAKIVLFVLAYIGLAVLTVINMKNAKKDSKEEFDRFAIKTTNSNTYGRSGLGYALFFIVLFIVCILAYLPWASWNVQVFDKVTAWVNELSLFGVPIISYIFGNFVAFGSWDIFTIQFVLLTATLLIWIFDRFTFDDILDSYGEGFAKMSPVVITLLFVYIILEITVMYPVIPVITDWFATISEEFSAFWNSIAIFIASLFGVEMQYIMSLIGTYYASSFAENGSQIALIIQMMYGLVSFFAPSSVILMLGLSYLNLPYKDWLKFIWKFLVALLLVIIIIIIII